MRLETLINTGGNVLVSFPSVVGQRYRMEFKNDLNVTNWSTFGDVVAARTNVTLSVTSTNEARFFRLRVME